MPFLPKIMNWPYILELPAHPGFDLVEKPTEIEFGSKKVIPPQIPNPAQSHRIHGTGKNAFI